MYDPELSIACRQPSSILSRRCTPVSSPTKFPATRPGKDSCWMPLLSAFFEAMYVVMAHMRCVVWRCGVQISISILLQPRQQQIRTFEIPLLPDNLRAKLAARILLKFSQYPQKSSLHAK